MRLFNVSDETCKEGGYGAEKCDVRWQNPKLAEELRDKLIQARPCPFCPLTATTHHVHALSP